jgi:hypothetical protein
MTPVRLSAVVLAAFVACGGGGPASTPSASPSNDAGRAKLLVLTQTDLPEGWRASPHKTDPIAAREDTRLAACSGAPDPATSQSADVFGNVFGQGAQTINSEVVYFKTPASAARAVAAIRSARAVACAKASARPVVAEQLRLQGLSAKIVSLTVTRRTLPVRGAVSAFRIAVGLEASGARIAVLEDVVILAAGRAQVRATFVDVGVPFPPALELTLVKKLSAKLLTA